MPILEKSASTSVLSLNSDWTLIHPSASKSTPVDIPFDVHSTLLKSGLINDPYWRDEELNLDWVHESEWMIRRQFDWQPEPGSETHTTLLQLSQVDCCTTIHLNQQRIGQTENVFLTHRIDVTKALVAGVNTLEITFHSNSEEAIKRAEIFPFELPYQTGNNRIGHVNHLRKVPCDAGWDWNIALMPLGVYGEILLTRFQTHRFDDMKIVQHHSERRVDLAVTLHLFAYQTCEVPACIQICGHKVQESVVLTPGHNATALKVEIPDPELWWPCGYGAQTLHELKVVVGDEERVTKIGFRKIELLTEPDARGESFVFVVNNKRLFIRGANWIPADALPQQINPERTQSLLQSAVDAHFNMIRVWGGGRYESEDFYKLCDEYGLLVWQDFMFSCNHYPAANRDWLNSVRAEATQQVHRLSAHPCVALWCGDNELIGALSWFEVTRQNRDRYLANYVILNHALEEVVEQAALDIPFWPSSPSSGRLNFGDAWHDDRSGDMHFWDVWHEAKSFEHYRTVIPRFCSEFGFQSFPSMSCIERFTETEDRNVSSPIMDIHQRNVGGNARIVETISRYFRFPDSFEKTVFLSQVSQALAMQTAVEWWRSNKPINMGTLFWQLNDTWPVASWASLEHGGAWKLVHYAARKFYNPVLVCVQPDPTTDGCYLQAVADCPEGAQIIANYSIVSLTGEVRFENTVRATIPEDKAIELIRLSSEQLGSDTFVVISWQDETGQHSGNSTYFHQRFKAYDLPIANVRCEWVVGVDDVELELVSDAPAFFVTVDLGGNSVYSDNMLTLLPNQPIRIRKIRQLHGEPVSATVHDPIPNIQHLTG